MFSVIPAKADVQYFREVLKKPDIGFHRRDELCKVRSSFRVSCEAQQSLPNNPVSNAKNNSKFTGTGYDVRYFIEDSMHAN